MLYFSVAVIFCLNEINIIFAANNESRIIFDQRQTGKYNIHVSIKDVAIIELDRNDFRETNSDPDYYYDESDFTIKPLLAWYQSLNTTKIPLTTEATGILSSNNTQTTVNLTSIIHTTTPTTPRTTSKKYITNSDLPQMLLPKSTTSRKPSSVVILGSQTQFAPTKPQNRRVETREQIPLHAVMEPVLHPKFRVPPPFPLKIDQESLRPSARIGNGNSRIFNFKARKASSQDSSKKQVRSSILGKLFSMLAAFHDNDDTVD